MGYASRANRARREREALYCYTDESGNTGNNLFDDVQPYFWTGTLVGRSTLSGVARTAVSFWQSRLGVQELHANELRLPGIEQIADEMAALLEEQSCRIVFTRIEKRFHARLKLVDTVLDSGHNHAVSNFHYGIRGLRLPLAHAIVECMESEDEEAFWRAYLRQDAEGLRAVLCGVRTRIGERVSDPRTLELLSNAFDWGIGAPHALLDGAGNFDSPNVVALTLILAGLHQLLEGTNARVLRFVHDHQSQFGHDLQAMHRLGRTFRAGTSPTSLITDITRVENIPADITFEESHTEAALQLVDVVLWMTKRAIQNHDTLPPACARLGRVVSERAAAMDFSRGSFATEVAATLRLYMTEPLSAEDLARGEALLRQVEAARIARRDRLETTGG